MEKEKLLSLQKVELSILIAIDKYCTLNGIKYSLIAGSLLGAVRHGGFIPWDDDIDIAMKREDYTKFCKCIKNQPLPGYIFTNFENDKNAIISHGKLGKLGTVFLQEGDIESIGHHEIWVDIFPLDKMSLDKKYSKTIRIGKELVLLTRANAFRKNDGIVKKAARIILKAIPLRYKRLKKDVIELQRLDKIITENYEWVSMSTMNSIKRMRFPMYLAENYIKIDFEGYQFMAFSGYKEILKIMYGDYMKLPPESERVCRHSPIKIVLGD